MKSTLLKYLPLYGGESKKILTKYFHAVKRKIVDFLEHQTNKLEKKEGKEEKKKERKET